MPKSLAEERAERGAKWFDKVYPEWFTHIDPKTLNLSRGCQCVWGQVARLDEVVLGQDLWRDYDVVPNGFGRAWVVMGFNGYPRYWFDSHGFAADDGKVQYEDLDDAWIDLVKDRYDRGLAL